MPLKKKKEFICELTRSIIFYFETKKIMLKWFEMGEITKKKLLNQITTLVKKNPKLAHRDISISQLATEL